MNGEFIEGRIVCATGRLVSMTHAELAELVRSLGGTFVRHLKRCGHLVVVGAQGWPAEIDGAPTRLFRQARRLRVCGYPIEFVREDDFLEKLELSESAGVIRSRYTLAELTRILSVSPVRIRRWMRAGLIHPVETSCRLARFDFDQVANAKQLHELLEQGVSLQSIRKGVEEVSKWLPNERLPLSQLTRLEKGKVALWVNGVLMEGSGQRLFDFNADLDEQSRPLRGAAVAVDDLDSLFDQALELEDNGLLQEAAQKYEQALAIDATDPVLHFNLGNVLYGLGRVSDAIAGYRKALCCDPHYAEAWNNLGIAYAERAEWGEAEAALAQALRLVPTYADAHFNMADVLEQSGKLTESQTHRDAYRRYSRAVYASNSFTTRP